MRVIRFLLGESFVRFASAIFASVVGGLLAISVLILLFRKLGQSDEVRLELFAILCAGTIGSRVLARHVIRSIVRSALSSLRVELFQSIVTAPLAEIERVGRSRLTLALTDDIGRIASIVPNLVVLCANVTLIFGCLVYLGWLSRIQLCVTLLLITVGVTCHFFARREGSKEMRITGQKRNDLLEAFRFALDGLKELKLHSARRRDALREFAARAGELEASAERQLSFFHTSAIAAEILFYMALGLALFLGAGGTDHQVIVSYGIAIMYLMGPLRGVVQIAQELAVANIALERLEELGFSLEQARSRQLAENASAVEVEPCGFQQLELAGATYSYETVGAPRETFVLGPIDLTLEKGDILFVVGANGSGKTTLAKLLAGLYLPDSGLLRVNGQIVTATNAEWYGQFISAIFHDFFVFDRLADGNEWPDELLRRFQLEGRIQFENNKILKTSALSAGERKRLALLFAYLDDKPIFVLDEWASDQDPSFKEKFYNDLLLELSARGKLVILISHDDRYFGLADKILLLDRGKPSLQLKQDHCQTG